jgi:hypothetical protein
MASDRGTLSRTGLGADQAPWTEPAAAAGQRLPNAPRERKPALFALAILLVALGAGAAGLLVIRAGAKVPAIEIVQQVNDNARIPATVMEEVAVSASSGISYVPWDQAGQVADYYAATTIPAGTLLTRNMVTAASSIGAKEDIVGLSLKAGQLPGTLEPGDKVEAFAIGSACDATAGDVLTRSAEVTSVTGSAETAGSTASVTVAVQPADAAAMTCAASNGIVGLALLPGNG